MLTVRFTMTGGNRFYATSNHVTWYQVTADQATALVEAGAELEMV